MGQAPTAELCDAIIDAWGFCGLVPKRVIASNDFGNVLVEDVAGVVWRICPEDLSCNCVAQDVEGLDRLWRDEDFLRDWKMERLVAAARETCGELSEGAVYHLVVPAPLGGRYAPENIRISPLLSVVRVAGSIQRQIEALPDGARVHLTVIDD
ncbi:MAG: T6SS immunity protein Tdi1 domain-containing protein [Tabrizicola sp.]